MSRKKKLALVPAAVPQTACVIDTFADPQPSRAIDIAVHRSFVGFVLELPRGPVAEGMPIPHYSTSLDAVTDLVETLLPGWSWRVCKGAATDDAWLQPDFTHPEHGAAFTARWPSCIDPFDDGPGLNISCAPRPRGAMALLACLLEVLAAIGEKRPPDVTVPAATAFFAAAVGPGSGPPAGR